MAAILDLQVTCMLNLSFDGFIGLIIVVNMYLDIKIMTLSSLLGSYSCFLTFSTCSAAILAAILDFQITNIFFMIFDSFIGSGMVENLYLDTQMFTLRAFLRELEPFYYGPYSPGGHLGRHLEYLKLPKVNFYPPDGK